ncbi:Non-heme 11 kDa protein of cytochrome bc1 complex [Neoconidiobolus thromboides FSU 785]|nr:Non-heme 11 kDa protein of cytochrome bc1 complex [Neoconidiobolus thromboides FSU 785]
MLSTIYDSFFPTVYAEEVEEEVVEEEEEEEEPEDTKPALAEECGNSAKCTPAKHHFQECEERVANGAKEDCVEEFFHYMHCVDECLAPKLFETLK